MESDFTTTFFVGNRQRLKELFTGRAPIIISANGLLQRGGDSSFAFAQDANFWYLTGIDEPDITLVIDKDKEYLIVPAREGVRKTFDGAVNLSALSKRSGITSIYEEEAGWELLSSRLKKVKHVATIAPPPNYIKNIGLYANPARSMLVTKLKTINDELELLDLAPHMSRLRMTKQASEIKAIKMAVAITSRSISESINKGKLSKYRFEYQLEAEIYRGFRRAGASGHAFMPIVAAGERACTLHNTSNNGLIDKTQSIVVDVGAEYDHYAADITRSVCSEPSKRLLAVHSAVLDVQNYAIELLKPGVLLKEYEQLVESYMGEKLRELALIRSIATDSVRQYYPHATSHFLGLNVHDVGDYSRPLEPGVVLTVEPGIYIEQESIGVRIEDDILITAGGNKILSGKLSRKLT